MHRRVAIFAIAFLFSSVCWSQQQPANNGGQSDGSMPGMDMPGHDMSKMKSAPADGEKGSDDASANAMHSMEGHMDMGPHMKMTALRTAKPGDTERAQQVVEAARRVSEKYKDYHVALNDGFKIFFPNVPQNMYHFTNYAYGREAALNFNPDHPTSLLYEKHGDDYTLIGVMYTAPKRFTEEDLDARIPLSVAQWHEHVNFCRAPIGHLKEYFGPDAKFGLKGSIATEEACTAAGGVFHPVILNWMVHLYPFEKDQASMWSVERQHAD